MDADIIVIGASPAGLMAARNAALKGANVILIERKEVIGNPTHPANTFLKECSIELARLLTRGT